MARARNIKPGFYKNEDLAECSIWARFIFPGLWMLADREGRLEDRPKRIKAELLPFDNEDVDPLLSELAARGFILRYQVSGGRFIQILGFSAHQSPHYSEKDSVIPAPNSGCADAMKVDGLPESSWKQPEESRNHHGMKGGSQPPDSLIPDSLIPESLEKHVGAPAPDPSPVIETLPLIKGGDYEVRQSLIAELEPIYPKVDIPATVREMKGWLIGNPARRKTRTGIKRFITTWLHNEQQKAEAM